MKSLLVLLTCAALVGCGSDDVPTGDEAANRAKELGEQTRSLAGEAARTGREVLEDPQSADDAPESSQVRDTLRQANERLAETADRLADVDRADVGDAGAEARERLTRVEGQLGEVADRLESQLPATSRRDLEDLREQIPSDLP